MIACEFLFIGSSLLVGSFLLKGSFLAMGCYFYALLDLWLGFFFSIVPLRGGNSGSL
jgi:hypothetical protein